MNWQDFEDNRGPGRPPKYPFRRMKVGECVFIPEPDARRVEKARQRVKPQRFKRRKALVDGVEGFRVWRIA
jgi:hypothetical protein